jgi:hypothetical protein
MYSSESSCLFDMKRKSIIEILTNNTYDQLDAEIPRFMVFEYLK